MNWRTFRVPNKIQSGEYSKDGDIDDLSHIFVANVNFNSADKLKVNVNQFENDNVWNAVNRHRFVIPKLSIFSHLIR